MFTVVTHLAQIIFQVLIIGYINLMAYVQHEIHNILRHICTWARTYVDDIMCRVKFLADLLKKLRILFDIFLHHKISITPTKSFLNYSDIELLDQQFNSLSLTTSKEKLRAIKLLTYPKILDALKYYLELTGYLHSYVHYYTQLAAYFQALKTSLLQVATISG